MRLLVLLAFSLLAGCAQVPLSAAEVDFSAGCANLNDPFYDDAYLSGNVYFSPFREGESITVMLENADAATTIYLIISDMSGETRQDFVRWDAPSHEALSYTFDQDRSEAEVYWSADAGVPRWEVICAGEPG